MKQFIKSEDWLPLLLRALDLMARPSPYNILRSFESWDHDTRLRPQLTQLVRARMLERRGSGRDLTLCLTPEGRLAALGGIDPVERWRRRWDGCWRLLLFDLPSRNQQLRLRLWRWLRTSRFGYLQHSVWVSPDPVSAETLPLRHLGLTPESFLVFEGRPSRLDTDAGLVKGAWDFLEINRHYERVLQLARQGLKLARSRAVKSVELRGWLAEDRVAWLTSVAADPLLPENLLPPGYRGRDAWEQREAALAALARRSAVVQNM